ncbi:MAG: HAD-IA family hydrolase [Ignavibacteria bacterium]
MLKAVLFDLDDTLFDHRHSMLTGLTALQNKYECFRRLTLDKFETEHNRLMNEVNLDGILEGLMTLDEGRALRFKRAFSTYGVDADETVSYEAAGIYRKNYVSVSRLVPYAKRLLEELGGNYKIGIVTNNLIDEQVRKLKENKIDHLIDVMVTSEEVKTSKPNKKIFEEALRRLETTAGETLMIGDSWQGDIAGAYNLGMKCIWMNVYDEKCPDPKMAAEIRSLKEVKGIISDNYK